MDEQVFELDIDLLQPNPLQPRGLVTPDSISELAESIRIHGILEPLVVAHTPAGYQIIAGERRWRAAKMIGLARVPVAIKETTPQGMLEMAIVENVQRVDLNPIERAQAYKRLMEEFGMGNSEIAERVGKSPAYISNSLRLLTLPEALQDALLSGIVTEGHVRALAAIEDQGQMIEALKEIIKDNSSVRRAEELARIYKSRSNTQGQAKEALIHTDEIVIIEKEIEKMLGAKAKILQSRIQTKVVILIKGEIAHTTEIIKRLQKAILQEFRQDSGVEISQETQDQPVVTPIPVPPRRDGYGVSDL
ncbi:MAG: ParB/RepB/Spo0J family partition protein [bacterium]|nr:ParB/RepB/Spo0J family partition protein [bacterium]